MYSHEDKDHPSLEVRALLKVLPDETVREGWVSLADPTKVKRQQGTFQSLHDKLQNGTFTVPYFPVDKSTF